MTNFFDTDNLHQHISKQYDHELLDIRNRVLTLGGERMRRGPAARDRIGPLTDREREVLALVGAGLSNIEIARRLFLVEGTVKSYLSTIFTRLGVRNRVQAAIIAYEAGLVTGEG